MAERTRWSRRTTRYATRNRTASSPKAPRHRQGDAEHRADRGEHRQPDATLVYVHRARQPRIHAPGPPKRREHEHSAEDPTPRRVVRQQDRDLSDREDEDQIEEELERGDLVLVAALILAFPHARTQTRISRCRSRLPARPRRALPSSSRGGSAPPRTSSRPRRCRRTSSGLRRPRAASSRR